MSSNLISMLSFGLLSGTPKPASFEKIRIRILSQWLLKKDLDCPVITLSSNFSGEGVTTVATGLARSFSTTEINKVLLLSLSNPHTDKTKHLEVSKLADLSGISEYIYFDEKLGADALTLINNNHNSALIEEHTSALLKKLRGQYNLIMVDAGSLNSFNSLYWLINSDYNVLVIDSSKTTRESLEHLKKHLENTDISIDGSILNKRLFPIPSYLYWLTK